MFVWMEKLILLKVRREAVAYIETLTMVERGVLLTKLVLLLKECAPNDANFWQAIGTIQTEDNTWSK